MNTSTPRKEAEPVDANSWLEIVRQQVNSLHFGVVQIVVHESRVVQIERTEKVRLERATPPLPTRTTGGL